MRRIALLAAVAALAGCGEDGGSDGGGSTAGASDESRTLPSGRYTCTGYIGTLWTTFGYIEVEGNRYRGMAHQPSEEQWGTYTVSGQGLIQWSRGLGSFQRNNAETFASQMSNSPGHFFLRYMSPGGNPTEIECTRE